MFNPLFSDRACRECGCTESNACVDPVHGACWWVEGDLCSHCEMKAATERARRTPLGLAVLFTIATVGAVVVVGYILAWSQTHGG